MAMTEQRHIRRAERRVTKAVKTAIRRSDDDGDLGELELILDRVSQQVRRERSGGADVEETDV